MVGRAQEVLAAGGANTTRRAGMTRRATVARARTEASPQRRVEERSIVWFILVGFGVFRWPKKVVHTNRGVQLPEAEDCCCARRE